MAFVPIVVLCMYLGWVSVLLGASLSSSVAAFRYQPVALRLPQDGEFYALLRLLGRFREARADGKGLGEEDILALEPLLTDSLLQELLCALEQIRVVSRAESGKWLLARDLDQVTLQELYEASQLRIPVSETYLPARDDTLGRTACQALDELRMPLRELLKRKVGDIYELPGEKP